MSLSIVPFILLPFALAIVVSLFLERACPAMGLMDWPGARKMQTQPVPRLGGLAIALPTLLFCLFRWHDAPAGQLAGALVVFVGGFWDDISSTNSVAGKLMFQIAGSLLFATTCDLTALHFTAVWIVAIRFLIFGFTLFLTNAANLMDNMNGLAGGLSLVVILSLNVIRMTVLHLPPEPLTGWLLIAAILGFLTRNYPQGKIYMGDQGSQFLGFLMATFATTTLVQYHDYKPERLAVAVLGLAVVLFGLFLYDVITVVIIRLREGRSPFVGDQCHISHRLVRRGLTPTTAVGCLIVLQIVFSGITIALVR